MLVHVPAIPRARSGAIPALSRSACYLVTKVTREAVLVLFSGPRAKKEPVVEKSMIQRLAAIIISCHVLSEI